MRPQLASLPKRAVFTRGERAMVDAMRLASGKEGLLITRTRTNFVAPSPSRTTSCDSCCVKDVRVSMRASPSGEAREVTSWPPAAPLARIATVSLVDMSPSTEMELNDRSTAWVRSSESVVAEMEASVARIPRRVAMFGWIMPAPFVMPAREYVIWGDEGSLKVRERSLGNVSVVQMARAAESQD